MESELDYFSYNLQLYVWSHGKARKAQTQFIKFLLDLKS